VKLCVAVAEPSVELARRAAARAAEGGAFAEIRLDALEGCDRLSVDDLAPFASYAVGAPLLLTFRRPRDGGRREVEDRYRLALLAEGVARFGALCDVEVDCAERAFALGITADRVVLSHHDIEQTPADLVAMFERMTEVPAAIYKIATFARRTSDAFLHFDVLARARARGRRVVAIAMGEKGVATRILAPAWGAAFTFCALEAGREAAAGQVGLDAMRDLYRADRATEETTVVGLVAGSIGYSRSPAMHNGAAAELGLDLVYVPFAVDDLDDFLARVRAVGWNARGFSITNPFKTEILAHLDRFDPLADRAGAVNTVVIDDDGRLTGYNTDVEGAMRPLEALAGDLAGLRVGVIGAGGAARALVCGLAARGSRAIVFARRIERARTVAERFGAEAAPLGELATARLDVLVNATPAGTHGIAECESPVEARALGVVDEIVDDSNALERTRLLEDAASAGCQTLGGLPMLATQAALQFELWTGHTVEPERMLELAAVRSVVGGS
jgi:3-dehydroquinate dehydratase/shikimate dehydrogenase